MPSPSYWPVVVALALPIIATGLIYSHLVAVAGGVVLLLGIYGWALEPGTAPDSDMDPPAAGGVPAVSHG
jgi:cytochrome c oxidase subunit 1